MMLREQICSIYSFHHRQSLMIIINYYPQSLPKHNVVDVVLAPKSFTVGKAVGPDKVHSRILKEIS